MTTIRNNRAPQILSKMQRAAARSLNRAVVRMTTVARRQLATGTGLPQKSVRRRLRQERANPTKLAVSVEVSGVPVRAIQLGAKQDRVGTAFGPRGARTLVKSAFIAKGRGGFAVFLRTTRKRGPLQAQLGEPLAVVATRERILEAMLEAGTATFQKTMAHEISRALSGAA